MIGQTVSHYRVIEELGQGGMGKVYKAEDTRLQRPVALKFLAPELTRDPEAKSRFVNEVRSIFTLEHQNICNVHELDETEDGQMYLCMAYYDGETLKDKLENGPIPIDEAVDMVRQVALGLEVAHQSGIIHRDIKPANIMITSENEVKLVDFGIAKLRGTTRFTKTGKTLGTLAYMSPEQTKGAEVDARSDVFSLGAVLYELLANRLAFSAEHEEAVAYQIVNEDPAPVTGFRADISPGLRRVLEKSMRKSVGERYQSVSEFREDLDLVLKHMKPHAGHRRRVRHNRNLAAILIGVIALLGFIATPASRDWIRGLVQGTSAPARQIAVLPFENIGGNPDNQALCDGLMQTLTSKLSELQRFHGPLWIIPASDVRAQGVSSAAEAGHVFGVNLVITGSVQRFPDGFRLTLNLIDVEQDTPRQLSSVVIDDRTANLALLQDDTVIKMAGMLNVELSPDSKTSLAMASTKASRAYEFYVTGLGYLQRYENMEELDLAIQYFEKSTDEDAFYALAYAGLGEAFIRKYSDTNDPKWMDLAIKNSERAVVLNDRLAPVHATLGLVYERTGRYENAIAEFESALAIDSLSAMAYRGLAGAYDELGEMKRAEATYFKAIVLKPDFWGGFNDLALFYYRQGRYREAFQVFGKITELTPDNNYGYNNMGACYYYMNRPDSARVMFEKSIVARPNYRAFSNLGALYYVDGRYEDSAEALNRALELNDTSYLTWTNLGNAYYWIPGRRSEALAVFRRCAEMAEENRKIDPSDEYVLIDLAAFYAILGDDQRARNLVDKVLSIAGDNLNIMYQAGHVYEQLGERDTALDYVGDAVTAGYPAAEIEGDPFMQKLTEDVRFRRLVEQVGE